ncbi:MAG: enoyl-CoA hydratase/isomerase family protein [Hyphomicrobiales bacterium]
MLTLTLSRPTIGNLVTMDMITNLTAGLKQATPETHVIVIRGAGADFCRGRDYQQAPEDARRQKTPSALEISEKMTTPILALYAGLKETAVPTLSIVQGRATGFGCALSCACDLVIAGKSALFSLPEIKERGLPPTLAMTALLDRTSYRNLAYLVFSASEIDASHALSAGLASAVHPDSDLEARASEVISTISELPLDTLRSVKRYLQLAPSVHPRARAELGSNLYAVVASSR